MTVAPTPHLRRAGLILTIASLAAISFATLLPQKTQAVGSVFCVVCGPLGGINSLLNVLLFVPLGVGLALCGFSWKRSLAVVFVLSILIESAQFLVIAGRYSNIGDVLTNALGGALGFVAARHASALLLPSRRNALVLSVAWSAAWLAIQMVTAFGFSTAIPRSEYYGQIARRLGKFEQFRGRVVRASIGDLPVPDSRFADSQRARELLVRGASVTTIILPDTSGRGLAPIVRVVDSTQREVLLVAQDGNKLIVGVRTGASVLRLRPPIFILMDPLQASSPGDKRRATDAVIASASYEASEARLIARTARANYIRHLPISTSLGWTMFLPFQWYIKGTPIETFVSAIWVAGLLLPLGYWAAGRSSALRASDSTGQRITAVGVLLAVLYAGLVAVPQAFGLTVAPSRDWLAALAGVLLGVLLAFGTQRRARPVARSN